MKRANPVLEKEFAQWEKTRAKGKLRFIIPIALLYAVGFFLWDALFDWL